MKYLAFVFAFFLACLGARGAEAATVTVCASGCDYTSISDAALFAGTGDTIQVNGGGGSPYSSATETFNIALLSASTTIQCINGATIGQANPTGNNAILLTTSSTVMGCTFSNVNLRIAPSTVVSGVIISGNTFSSTATGTISFAGEANNFSILNNSNIGLIEFSATTTNGLVEGNTIYGRTTLGSGQAGYFLSSVSSSLLTVRNNAFNSYVTTTGDSSVTAVVVKGSDVTFVTNTIRMVNTPPSAIIGSLGIHASGTVNVSGNKIDSPIRGSGTCQAVTVSPPADVVWSQVLTFQNNTIRLRCDDGGGLNVTDVGYPSVVTITATIRRNAFYGSTTGAALRFLRGIGTSYSITNSDNGIFGFAAEFVNAGSSNATQGTGYKTTNPILRTDDVDTTNDIEIAPFSDYLDYSGTNDIGATTGTRRTTIYVDDSGTVDYSAVDATGLVFVTSTLRSGDTLSLAAGTYSGFYVSSTTATTSLTIAGAGVSTIINAGTNQNALLLTNVTSSAVSGLVLQNASSTSSGYTGTRMGFAYLGNAYDQASAGAEILASSTVLIAGGCSISTYGADGTSLTSFLGDATSNVNVGLIDVGDGRVTALVRNDVASSGGALSTLCGGMTVDRFVSSAFTVSGGVYTYQSATVASAGLTLSNGVTTPAITRTTVAYAGLKLDGSGGIIATNVTSTVNGYGIWFSSGGGNSLVDSVLSSSSLYDVYQAATAATNTLDNVTFTRVSSTVDILAKPLLVKFRVRVRTYPSTNGAGAVSGSAVTVQEALLPPASSLGSTGSDGYTSYSRLPAYTITNASNDVTNGGYNPYIVNAGSVTGYAASSTSATISSRDQTVSIALVANAAPTAPSAASAGSITATGATISWTDNSDDETSFLLDYVSSTLGVSFEGTTSTIAADTTSSVLTGLYPNLGYQARVTARNAIGDSAYSTTAVFRTLAATPDAPTVTALSRTTASVAINANNNSTSTEYVLYNVTSSLYVDATGASSAAQAWQTTTTWAGVTISGLTCGTSYSFLAVARNADSVVSASSTSATLSTTACATSSGGGGGGGGGIGGGIGIPLAPILNPLPLAPVTTAPVLPSIEVTFLDEPRSGPPPVSVPGTSDAPVIPPSAASLRALDADARSFQVALTQTDRDRLASFVDTGTTPETRALGSGERRALLRDALQTIGRSNVPTSDLERLARGRIPATRNLEIERTQVPRARTTFRTIYGRDPDFRNPEENLAWNTLMYRIRFPRDLAQERQGIQEFRTLFRRDPQDPFQWAVVRALGYVER